MQVIKSRNINMTDDGGIVVRTPNVDCSINKDGDITITPPPINFNINDFTLHDISLVENPIYPDAIIGNTINSEADDLADKYDHTMKLLEKY